MSYFIFGFAMILGILFQGAFSQGVIGIVPAFLVLIVMLTLSFHVLARGERPDGTSIRIASFSAVLWYAAILGSKLAMEGRSFGVTAAATVFTLFCGILAGFSTWSVSERPLNYDVEEAD